MAELSVMTLANNQHKTNWKKIQITLPGWENFDIGFRAIDYAELNILNRSILLFNLKKIMQFLEKTKIVCESGAFKKNLRHQF